MRKVICLLLCVVVVFGLSTVAVANADVGPNPSVHVTFKNMGDEACYGTLLSSTRSTGPFSTWNEDLADDEQYDGYMTAKSGLPAPILHKFVDYQDSDGYFFLCKGWSVSDSMPIHWGYYPPKKFKILLYYPERDKFVVSEVCERYAFDTYYTVNMSGVDISSVDAAPENTKLKPQKSYPWGREVLSFFVRVIITVAIEMFIAFLFGIRGKKAALFVLIVNLITQIVLNVFVNIIDFKLGTFFFLPMFYCLFEFVIFVAEGVTYALKMKNCVEKPRNPWFYVLYAFVANLLSFVAGFGLAYVVPALF